jgi:hypothetical protein
MKGQRTRTVRSDSGYVWPKVLGENPVDLFQEEKRIVKRIAALIDVEGLIRGRFSGTLHVVFVKGLPRSISSRSSSAGADE